MDIIRTVKKTLGWASFVFTAAMLVVMLTPLPNRLASFLVVGEGPAKTTDVIAVLGGGAYSNGVPGGASNERLIRAVLLYREGRAARIVFTGGQVVGVKAKLGHTVFGAPAAADGRFVEAVIMRDMAVGMGVPAEACLVEAESLSTFENLRGLKAIMEREGMRTAAIVSSPVHMRRALMTAARLGIDFTGAPALDATMQKTTPMARLHLMRDVLWEYLAIGLYRARGQL